MRVHSGDLLAMALNGQFDVIVHGCNCQNTMGAGIAKQIRAKFPEAWEADRTTLAGDRSKLGTISCAEVTRPGISFVVVNAYTQFDWKGTGNKADLAAIESAMQEVKRRFAGLRIGYPRIGAGLAGGDWQVISQHIDRALQGEDHILVEFAAPQLDSSFDPEPESSSNRP